MAFRRSTFPWSALALLAAAAGIAACSVSFDSLTSANPEFAADRDATTPPADVLAPGVPGAEPSVTRYRGSPLCAITEDAPCNPDLPAAPSPTCFVGPSTTTASTATSVAPATDAGAPSDAGTADAGFYELACRVQKLGDDDVAPACATPGAGRDGAQCLRSSECAAGYECVSPGRCQRYCCSLSCSSSEEFCDLTPTAAAPDLVVPVCVPMDACQLLGSQCSKKGMTCAVVTSEGQTSCVAIGPAKAGESCETTHCGENLTCLGQPGRRTCFQLCRVNDAYGCPTSQKCRGSWPLFRDANIGVCE